MFTDDANDKKTQWQIPTLQSEGIKVQIGGAAVLVWFPNGEIHVIPRPDRAAWPADEHTPSNPRPPHASSTSPENPCSD
jgi:hypothetical protein